MNNDKYQKEIKELIAMSKVPPSDDDNVQNDKNFNDELFEVRGSCYILLDSLSLLINNLIESVPFDLIRRDNLDLIATQLAEIRDTHFGEFSPEEELGQ